MKVKPTLIFVFCFFLFISDLSAQVKIPELSACAKLTQEIGLTEIEIKYRRPSRRGRVIYGDLVPYDTVWRTGANECTSISFTTDLKFNGEPVPAGEYGIFTIPNPDSWTIILNKNAKQWGAFRYSETEDQIRLEVVPILLKDTVETFEIGFKNVDDHSGDLTLAWENTLVQVKLASDVDAMVEASIKKMLAENSTSSWDYYFAAKYYFRHDQNFQKVKEWMEYSITLDPVYWVIFEYAEMLKQKNETDKALNVAQNALQKSHDANDPKFAKNNILPLIELLKSNNP